LKYKIKYPKQKKETSGGAYWQGADFNEHLILTEYQTTYHYLLKNYPPPQKVLEAGCGIGRWVIPLAQNKYDVTGIELEEEALNIINQNYTKDNITLVHGDIFKMPFLDQTFDIVISLGVLEHFEDPLVQQKAISEHFRVFKDDGMFLITVPFVSLIRLLFHFPYLILQTFVRKIKKKTEYFSEYRYSRRAFEKVIKKANLKVVEIVYDDLLPPYNFGLMDNPVRKLFKDNETAYKIHKFGAYMFKLLWKIHPRLVSGGIGFVCQK
jgi:ubiquinone/menaquinone biosynthesis C-methylase UbiE